jgi:hypothetical protein
MTGVSFFQISELKWGKWRAVNDSAVDFDWSESSGEK